MRTLGEPSAIVAYDVSESAKIARSKKYVPALDGLRGIAIPGLSVYGPRVWRQLGTSQTLLSNVITLLAVVALTVLVALLSWYLIERPFVRLKRLFVYA